MSALSNFLGLRDADSVRSSSVRLARRDEIEPGLRLILAGPRPKAADETVLGFLQFALQRGIDLNAMWVVIADDKLVWAVLPLPVPGRTMLVFAPTLPPRRGHVLLARQAMEAACRHWAERGVRLAQVLIESDAGAIRSLHAQCGFQRLADLIYMERQVHRPPAGDVPPGLSLHHYSPQNHSRFARAIQQSYAQSLDCPALNGRRDIEDVVAGHKAGGEFDPRHWLMLCEHDEPLGVLLLARVPASLGMELVYLGLAPAARGRGLGDWFMQQAIRTAHEAGCNALTLAVDAANPPALRLYQRHGFRRFYVREAMVRELSPADADALPR